VALMGAGSLDLLDWRRRVADLYARVRAVAHDDRAAAHDAWRRGRGSLFAGHPQSPLAEDDLRRVSGLPVAAYDPALRFTAPLPPPGNQLEAVLEVAELSPSRPGGSGP